jgi:tetratricopeptide (TPR) repeat protein
MKRFLAVLAIAALASVNLAAQPAQDPVRRSAPSLLEVIRKNMVELRRASWAPPAGPESPRDLKSAVEQVKAMDLSMTAIPPGGRASDAAAPKAVPQVAATATTTQPQSQPAARNPIDAATLEQLKKTPPGNLKEVLAIADALFSGKDIEDAAVFYDLALRQSPSGQDKGWILFQLGNCRRTSDPAAARVLFKQLVEEVPDCPWANLASAVTRVIDWEMAEKPEAAFKKPVKPTTTNVAKPAE